MAMTGEHAVVSARDKKHIFVVNPHSFRHRQAMDAAVAGIEEAFKRSSIKVTRRGATLSLARLSGEQGGIRGADYTVYVSRHPRDAVGAIQKLAAAAPKKQAIRVYAVGGDGILFDCLNAIIGLPNAELAAIPYGRENDFIRAFGEDLDPLFKDIVAQATSPAIPTDVILCGENYAMNFCSVGIESLSIMKKKALCCRFEGVRDFVPWLDAAIYYASTILASGSSRVRRQRYTIDADGADLSGQYAALHISNGPCYGRRMTPVPEALPDDGLLDLLFAGEQSAFCAFRTMPDFVRGAHMKGKYAAKRMFMHTRAHEATITSDELLVVDLDGESFFDTSVTVKVVPGGVRFVSPGGMRFAQRLPYPCQAAFETHAREGGR